MTYAEALHHLQGLGPELPPPKDSGTPRRKFDLAHMRRLLAALGNPQHAVPAILIAGTNGKGSTAATLASILTAAGYRTALYTSPHLIRVTERIQLAHPILPSEYGSQSQYPGSDGPLLLAEIPEATFADLYAQVEQQAQTLVHSGDLPHPPSFFERLTAIAFLYYAQQQAQVAVLEVGLGGRLDATNVVAPILSIVTDIALDHQDYLGDTIAQITAEKCGILRENGTLITLPQLPEANQAIGVAATALNVHAINSRRLHPPHPPARKIQTQRKIRAPHISRLICGSNLFPPTTTPSTSPRAASFKSTLHSPAPTNNATLPSRSPPPSSSESPPIQQATKLVTI